MTTMVTKAKQSKTPRVPLSRERVLQGAIELADSAGIEALTMRRLAESLGVEAMSLYYHVANKEALLDGVIDTVVAEMLEAASAVEGPDPHHDWKGAMRARIMAARSVMMRHRWAPPVFETRTEVSLTAMTYFNGLLEIMRAGGFSYDLAHHAMHTLGSRALGFAQELFEPDDGDEPAEDDAESMQGMADQFPYLVEMLTEITHDGPDDTLGWCDDETEFKFSLDVILDGLELRLRAETA